ncbi:hypothetical protein diail_6572 [Diaporthe ilicicola]|nr:hypothetical protein diail_6572 [Diaporthe ilicicola]
MASTATPNPAKDIWNPLKVLQDDATIFYKEHDPAKQVVAGKTKKNRQGGIDGVNVLYQTSASAGEAKATKAEIDKIGKILDAFGKQQQVAQAEGFKFGGEEYQAKKERCRANDATCFSGSKHRLGSKGIYAMMTKEGYVVIVKTDSFSATQLAVEGGKGLVDGVRKAAIKYAKSQVRK